MGHETEPGSTPGRDPRRSLLIGSAIAAVVLGVLGLMVAIGIYAVFSARP